MNLFAYLYSIFISVKCYIYKVPKTVRSLLISASHIFISHETMKNFLLIELLTFPFFDDRNLNLKKEKSVLLRI